MKILYYMMYEHLNDDHKSVWAVYEKCNQYGQHHCKHAFMKLKNGDWYPSSDKSINYLSPKDGKTRRLGNSILVKKLTLEEFFAEML